MVQAFHRLTYSSNHLFSRRTLSQYLSAPLPSYHPALTTMNPEQSSIASPIAAPPSPIALETREASPSTSSLWKDPPVSRPQSPSPLDRIDLDNKSSPTCVSSFLELDFKARHDERGSIISFPPMTFLSRSDSDSSVESELSQLFHNAPPPPQLLRIKSQTSNVEQHWARPSDPVARILLEQFSDAEEYEHPLLGTCSKYYHHYDVQGPC